VYAELFYGDVAAKKMMESPAWGELELRMNAGIVVLCKAGCSWLVDNGTRLMPDDLEAWMRVDTAFRALLEARVINYIVISKRFVSLKERVDVVRMAVEEGAKERNRPETF
jgi:hypothetical protein